MVILKKIETPQDIYVIGDYIENLEPLICLTDDEYPFDLKVGNNTPNFVETSGFVYILTKEELLTLKGKLNEDELFADNLVIENFCGEIVLKVISENNNDLVTNENFDPKEYICYQDFYYANKADKGDQILVELIFNEAPSKINMSEFALSEEYLNELIAIHRDEQITEIFKD